MIGASSFSIICPKFDFDSYYNEYHAGTLQIADVKAFGATVRQVGMILRDTKRDSKWINPDYREMLRDHEAARD